MEVEILPSIDELIRQGAVFVANHSGGKDSQAMLIKLLERVPASKILVVHASLGEAEWPGALELAEAQAKAAGVEFVVARATKTFFDMVDRRYETRPDAPSWPSASNRQCTSDLKRDPIAREIRRYSKANATPIIVNCMGIRAQESPSRAKKIPFRRDTRNSLAGRDWFDWLVIHEMTTDEVFGTIKDAGQEPHYAYALGNDRLSCVFCILASRKDLKNGAKHNPELFRKYVEREQRTGYTMHQSRKSLTELVS